VNTGAQNGSHFEAPETGRSLVPFGQGLGQGPGLGLGESPAGRVPRLRASATFLAHLIATAQQAPQTRSRRRAEPEHATTAYAAAAPRPKAPSRWNCRSM
jgi:hypothetical protein